MQNNPKDGVSDTLFIGGQGVLRPTPRESCVRTSFAGVVGAGIMAHWFSNT